MALSQLQKHIVVVLLLGDGHLEFDKFKASRLQIKQAECKKEYVFWLYKKFMNKVKTGPKQRPDTRQWYFSTRSIPDMEKYRLLFYAGKRKVVPKNIKKLLASPLSLAVWFMDDGTLDYRVKSHFSFTLSTDAFTTEEVMLLKDALADNFGIESLIQRPSSRGKRYTKLYVCKTGREKFLKTISPHILSCFRYKIPPHYNLTPQRLILRANAQMVR